MSGGDHLSRDPILSGPGQAFAASSVNAAVMDLPQTSIQLRQVGPGLSATLRLSINVKWILSGTSVSIDELPAGAALALRLGPLIIFNIDDYMFCTHYKTSNKTSVSHDSITAKLTS